MTMRVSRRARRQRQKIERDRFAYLDGWDDRRQQEHPDEDRDRLLSQVEEMAKAWVGEEFR